MQEGFFVKIRETKGAEKMAACGQLGNLQLRRELSRRREAAYEEEHRAIEAEAEAKGDGGGRRRFAGTGAAPAAAQTRELGCGRKALEW